MQMIPVRSSAITAIGFDPLTSRMKVTFIEGHTHYFCRVPVQVFEEFLEAHSKGSYYNDHVRDRYQC